MGEYVDRYALNDELAKLVPYAIADSVSAAYTEGLNAAHNALLDFPAADVVPVVHAKWVRKYNVFRSEYDGSIIEGYDPACSACDSWSPGLGKYKFCPYCGAKMDA